MEDFWDRSMLDFLDIDEQIAAAEEGDEDAMEALAQIYLNGDEDQDIEPDLVKCVYWLTKLAEIGNATAMFNLGLHYAKGYGVKRNFAKAIEWMEKAAEAGDEDAPETRDRYRKLANAEKKAASGDAQAQADLAHRLMELGTSLSQAGVGNDFTESVKWAKLASAQNNADAMWVLALAYEHGRGVRRNIDTALSYISVVQSLAVQLVSTTSAAITCGAIISRRTAERPLSFSKNLPKKGTALPCGIWPCPINSATAAWAI